MKKTLLIALLTILNSQHVNTQEIPNFCYSPDKYNLILNKVSEHTPIESRIYQDIKIETYNINENKVIINTVKYNSPNKESIIVFDNHFTINGERGKPWCVDDQSILLEDLSDIEKNIIYSVELDKLARELGIIKD